MATTYTPIATQTLSSNQGTVTFSSIPSTYTDLILVISGTEITSGQQVDMRVGNGSVDTGTNYSSTIIYGDGTSTGSLTYTSAAQANIGYLTTSQANVFVHLMSYSSTLYKTMLSRGDQATVSTSARVHLWRSTSAINIITIIGGNNFATGTTFTLYGIKSA